MTGLETRLGDLENDLFKPRTLTTPFRHCPILCPRVTLQFLESRKKTGGFDYLNMLMDTSKPGLQSSKPDKALNTIGRTKFRMVMVSEGAKLSNVCKNEFIFAAACWNVWMKRKKKQFNLQFLIELLQPS